MPISPQDRDRVRAKFLEVRQRLREALRLILEALQHPDQSIDVWGPAVSEELRQAHRLKRRELVVGFPSFLGVRFEDLYVLLQLYLRYLEEHERWRFTGDDRWIDAVLDAIDAMLRQLEQTVSGASNPSATGGLTQCGDALRMLGRILRRLRASRNWIWRWFLKFFFRRWHYRMQRALDEAIHMLGELEGTDELNEILMELEWIDRVIEGLPLPVDGPPTETRRWLERVLERIDQLFRRFDRLGAQ